MANKFVKIETQEDYDSFREKNKSFLLLFLKKENCKLTKTMREIIVELAKTYDFRVAEITGVTKFCLKLKNNMCHRYADTSIGLYPTLIIFKGHKNNSAIADHYKIKNLGDIHQGESIEIKRFIDTCSKSMLLTHIRRVFPRKELKNKSKTKDSKESIEKLY